MYNINSVFYAYVLWSKKDKKLYVGWTKDLKKRLEKHQLGLVPATKPRRLLKLIFYEAFLTKEDAVLREKYLKTGWGRRHLKQALKHTLAGRSLNS